MDIAPGKPVTFKVRTFGTTDGEEGWSFGDGATGVTKSDGNIEEHAKNGFAAITHIFAKPGDYIVRAERTNRLGQKAIAHLWVPVGGSRDQAHLIHEFCAFSGLSPERYMATERPVPNHARTD